MVAGEEDVATIGAGMEGTTEVEAIGVGAAMIDTAAADTEADHVEDVVAVAGMVIARVDGAGKVNDLRLSVTAGIAEEVIRLMEDGTLMVEVTGDMGAVALAAERGDQVAIAMNLIPAVLSSHGKFSV